MDCQQCGQREAVVRLTHVVGGEVKNMHLCERCAAEKGVETGEAVAKTPLGTFLAAMGKGVTSQLPVAAGETGSCAGCGANLQDFRDSGRLGCSTCYEMFETPLRELLRRLHGSTFHTGERYVAAGAGEEEPAQLAARLREQLRLAVETENFELAAELRDRLRGLE